MGWSEVFVLTVLSPQVCSRSTEYWCLFGDERVKCTDNTVMLGVASTHDRQGLFKVNHLLRLKPKLRSSSSQTVHQRVRPGDQRGDHRVAKINSSRSRDRNHGIKNTALSFCHPRRKHLPPAPSHNADGVSDVIGVKSPSAKVSAFTTLILLPLSSLTPALPLLSPTPPLLARCLLLTVRT
ncbi:hypothetical protein DB88DRAFT_75083 [Papiliotrema laurentii]|uniref:Uncharacterized protein n=1 Tax=Papiliotrema laurentii TaxID=5418 RepID=A0AAD9CUB1_PAPLA|nr:hypothetical protein DB88DRAFT_75083 [Papiliotrema laurentii]